MHCQLASTVMRGIARILKHAYGFSQPMMEGAVNRGRKSDKCLARDTNFALLIWRHVTGKQVVRSGTAPPTVRELA
jgi:hypothetical protein